MPRRLKMPAKPPGDDSLSLRSQNGRSLAPNRDGSLNGVPDKLTITCGDQELTLSEHNAWALTGLLSLFLGIPLTKAARKAIRF